MLVVHACLSAFVLGTMFHYLLRKDPAEEALTILVNEANTFARHWALPPRLRIKLLDFIQFQHKKGWSTSTFSLPRSMEIQVVNALFRPAIEKSFSATGILNDCSFQYLDSMLVLLREVFLMPSEEVLRAGKSSLQLAFVVSGRVEEMHGDVVRNIIRSDVDTCSSILAVSFFFGIPEIYSVRAFQESDVRLLVLSADDGEKLNREFPEQQEIIRANILRKYGLDSKGRDLAAFVPDHSITESKAATEQPERLSTVGKRDSSSSTANTEEAKKSKDEDNEDWMRIREALRETVKKRTLDHVLALIHAADRGDAEEVRRLVRSRSIDVNWGDYDGKTLVHLCAAQGKYRMVEILLEEGANKNATDRWDRTPMQEAIENKHFHVVEVLNHWNAKMSAQDEGALCEASGSGDLDRVRHLIKSNSDPSRGDYDRRTPLHIAAANGHAKVVEFLLHKGSHVNSLDRWGYTPLYDALMGGSSGIVSTIVQKGGILPPKITCEQMCGAAADGNVLKLRMLMDCGLTPDVMDYDLRTPLHLAAAGGRVLAVSFLLGQGADPCAADRWGNAPLDDAVKGDTLYHLYCAKLIHMHGGQMEGSEEEQQAARQALDNMSVAEVRRRVKTLLAKGADKRTPQAKSEREIMQCNDLSHFLIAPSATMSEIFRHLGTQFSAKLNEMKDLQTALTHITSELVEYQDKNMETVFSRMRFHQFLDRLQDKDEFDGLTWLDQAEEVTDEQYRLYQELDHLQSSLPIADKMASRMRARCLQHTLLHLSDITDMHAILTELCVRHSPRREAPDRDEKAHLTIDSMYQILLLFVSVFLPLPAVRTTAKALIEEIAGTATNRINLSKMLAASQKFRELLMNEESKAKIVLGAMNLPNVFKHLSYSQHMVLSGHCAIKVLEVGDTLPVNGKTLNIIVSGSLSRVTHEAVTVEITPLREGDEWNAGSVLGEVALLTGLDSHFMTQCSSRCVLVEIPRTVISAVFTSQPKCVLGLAKTLPFVNPVVKTAAKRMQENAQAPKLAKKIKRLRLKFQLKTTSNKDRDCDGCAADDESLYPKMNKSWMIWTLLHVFHQFPEMGREFSDGALATAKLVFFCWKGVSRFNASTNSSRRSEQVDDRQQGTQDGHIEGVNELVYCLRRENEDRIVSKVREGLRLVDESWAIFCANGRDIQVQDLLETQPYLGEVGGGFFEQCLRPLADRCAQSGTIEEEKYWEAWMNYLDGTTNDDGTSMHGTPEETVPDGPASPNYYPSKEWSITAENTVMEMWDRIGMNAMLLRRAVFGNLGSEMRTKLWGVSTLEASERTIVLEQSYRSVVGDLEAPLMRADVKKFLQLVLIGEQIRLDQGDVDFFIELCSTAGESASYIAFEDIRSLFMRGGKNMMMRSSLFVGTALNPLSRTFCLWHTLVEASAIYLILEVPFRIAFEPFDSIHDSSLQYSGFAIDGILVLNFVVNFFTAYQNKESIWVSNHAKMTKHNLSHGFVSDAAAIIPIDWLMWWSGNVTLANYLRLIKLTVVNSAYRRKDHVGYLRIAPTRDLTRLAVGTFFTLHWCSCFWFLIGGGAQHLKDKARQTSASWFTPLLHEDLDNYAAVPTPQDSNYWWPMYLVSYLWISTTMSTQGVIDNLLPQTYQELSFTMLIMLLSVTAYNYAVGTIGSHVMSLDEHIVRKRNKLGAVSAYLQAKGLHGELMQQILSYFSTNEVSSIIPMSTFMRSLNLGLQHEVASFICADYLQRTPLFRACSGPMLDNLKLLLRDLDLLGGEVIYKQGNVAYEIFIVILGSVSLTITDDMGHDEENRVLGVGESVGDLECFFQMRHAATCKASYLGARCLRLKRERLMTILKMHPDDERVIAANAADLVASAKNELHNRSASSRATRSIASHSSFGRSSRGSGASRVSRANSNKTEVIEADRKSKGDKSNLSSKEFNTASVAAQSESNESFKELLDNEISQAVFSLSARRQKEQLLTHFTNVARGELHKVQQGVQDGIPIDGTDANGRTSLHVAASSGQRQIVKFLLDMSAQTRIVDIYKNTPLVDAVRSKHDLCAQLLHDHDPDMVLALTDGGGNAVQLINAAFHQDREQMERLLKFGVSVNERDYDNRTALHIAASEGYVEIVQFLLDSKADVNAIDRFGGSPLTDAVRDRFGGQSDDETRNNGDNLAKAARHDHWEAQAVLRLAGGKLVGVDAGVLLCEIASTGNLSELKAYCDNGIDLNSQDYDGRTALHLAAANEQIDVLNYLLACTNIDVNMLDRYEATALDDAIRHKCDVAKTMILAHGGLSKHDPEVRTRLKQIILEKKDRDNAIRRSDIEEHARMSPEGKACVWVKGRCGKLIPMAMTKVGEHSRILLDDLMRTVSVIKRIDVDQAEGMLGNVGHGRSKKFWGIIQDKMRKNSTTLTNRDEEHEQEILQASLDLRATLLEWLERMYSLHTYISEDLPRVKIVKWAAHQYCIQRDTIMQQICTNISLAKFLIREMELFKDTVEQPEATLLRSTALAVKLIQKMRVKQDAPAISSWTKIDRSLSRENLLQFQSKHRPSQDLGHKLMDQDVTNETVPSSMSQPSFPLEFQLRSLDISIGAQQDTNDAVAKVDVEATALPGQVPRAGEEDIVAATLPMPEEVSQEGVDGRQRKRERVREKRHV